ncbi:hypothetical protein BKA67DRAFT_513155 [Truncatella angustata]|uniref:Carrier domain-containing protein n=1 Tax=Truncatella angustata TaxID=152316 RepID=A0A9P9A1B6_9PEZI|nr:uncharacterized protein BKA67DRAFT_513155 [Truncatella angustata]KAH6657919.1 hypothetical protein BKA67DRAFT_513155 [Truncatella angustata]KAH8197743.1 hypothetical protein TruAng_008077 [Truncatella angustata]
MYTLIDIPKHAASTAPTKQLLFYTQEHTIQSITYLELYTRVQRNAKVLMELGSITNRIILLHLDSQFNYVVWFWSVIAAGMIPAVSTPLPANTKVRDRHLKHIKHLLGRPLVITTRALVSELSPLDDLSIVAIEDLARSTPTSNELDCDHYRGSGTPLKVDTVAFMMLTSGSTGGAKAVEISHAQVLAALDGKSQTLQTSGEDVFLNWIGFDHVACVTEIHLHAMRVCAKQIHLPPSMAIHDPILWLKQLSDNSVSITFAPNFFLAEVTKAMEFDHENRRIDLVNLRHVVSGGEANKVSTGIAFNKLAKRLGCTHNVLRPAFGMTESCAGSIYNLEFPPLGDVAGEDFCSVGTSIHTMDARIVDSAGHECEIGQNGELQLKGPSVFNAYHNDMTSTESSFASDGWFKTGDVGHWVSSNRSIMLVGRNKDTIIINGINYYSHEIEAAIEDLAIKYLVPSFTAVFPIWAGDSDTEEVVVTFALSEGVVSDEALAVVIDKIRNAVFLHCSRQPSIVIPLPLGSLNKSSLGKLSRFQLKQAFEKGRFQEEVESTSARISSHRRAVRKAPETETEKFMARFFAEEFSLDTEEVSLEDSMVGMGMDSIRLMRFKDRLQKQLDQEKEIPIGLLLSNPSVGSLAKAIEEWNDIDVVAYNPVIVLQSGKSGAVPVWFIHPGLGEVLVFLNISRYFTDRQAYALRAPGFNRGEEMFSSIDDMTDVYMDTIRRHQPHGPYVLIGYSFGSMIAFEITKKLEAAGHEVFMGSLNGPPHIKWRMIQIDWCELFLNLSYFLGFLTEEAAVKKSAEFHQAGYTRHEIVDEILAIVPAAKLKELDLSAEKLAHWADVSSKLQGLAHSYDPTGKVQHIDVFYADPLLAVSNDKELWLQQHLHPWNEFCQGPVRFHDSPGAHYTMLNPDHVFVMQKVLRSALKARGV